MCIHVPYNSIYASKTLFSKIGLHVLQKMVLGQLDFHMQKNDTGPNLQKNNRHFSKDTQIVISP